MAHASSHAFLKSVADIPVAGRRVFLRVDFNVPRDKESKPGKITFDDTRILEALPTIRYLLDQKAKIILASHLGRPKSHDPKESLISVAERLSVLLDREVIFPEDCIGDAVKKLALNLREGQVMLLENLRFHPEEEANDSHFADSLAKLAEVYITDAFGVLHRTHASTSGMVSHFKEKGIGFLVKREIEFLGRLLDKPEKPFLAVLGGAKVSDKIGLIENLLPRLDGLLLGGGLAYTFLKAQGKAIGQSRCEDDKIHVAQKILDKSQNLGVPLYLPVDHRVAEKMGAESAAQVVTEIPAGVMGLDIGPKTAQEYGQRIRSAKTIFWNGPMGVFEFPAFAEGTNAVASAIAEASSQEGGQGGALSIVGGGESVQSVKKAGVAEKISHLSTGGGASLKYLEGKSLPGLKVLESV